MKNLVAFLALTLSLTAAAQERVVINSDNVYVNASEAIIVRTSETPNTVELTFLVPMASTVCERHETRMVARTSGLQCGYNHSVRRVRVGEVCVRRNPGNGACLRTQVTWRDERVAIPRTCMVPESYCASYGSVVSTDTDKVKIKFKGLPRLGGTEEETFLVRARQKNRDNDNVIYDIIPQQTVGQYEVKSRGWFGADSYVIKER